MEPPNYIYTVRLLNEWYFGRQNLSMVSGENVEKLMKKMYEKIMKKYEKVMKKL